MVSISQNLRQSVSVSLVWRHSAHANSKGMSIQTPGPRTETLYVREETEPNLEDSLFRANIDETRITLVRYFRFPPHPI